MRPNLSIIKCKHCKERDHFASQCPTKQKRDGQKVTHVRWSYNNEDEGSYVKENPRNRESGDCWF